MEEDLEEKDIVMEDIEDSSPNNRKEENLAKFGNLPVPRHLSSQKLCKSRFYQTTNKSKIIHQDSNTMSMDSHSEDDSCSLSDNISIEEIDQSPIGKKFSKNKI
jgi:hypothetical protein